MCRICELLCVETLFIDQQINQAKYNDLCTAFKTRDVEYGIGVRMHIQQGLCIPLVTLPKRLVVVVMVCCPCDYVCVFVL